MPTGENLMSNMNDKTDDTDEPQPTETEVQETASYTEGNKKDDDPDAKSGDQQPNEAGSRPPTDDELTDPPRETTPGRGQGHGRWLEEEMAETLEEWGYRTETRVELLSLNADIIARREELQDEPDDYLVVQCKDWEETPIGKQPIIRLCLLAFIARAMPVLCHTSRLTQPAWELAQAYDVRLLNLSDRQYDRLPPLTTRRPPGGRDPHRREHLPSEFRSRLPVLLRRSNTDKHDIEGPVFGAPNDPPCYVADRTGHSEYMSACNSDYTFHDRRS